MDTLDTQNLIVCSRSVAIDAVLQQIRACCARHGMSETGFGRLIGDPSLVGRLRSGQGPGVQRLIQIAAAIRRLDATAAGGDPRKSTLQEFHAAAADLCAAMATSLRAAAAQQRAADTSSALGSDQPEGRV